MSSCYVLLHVRSVAFATGYPGGNYLYPTLYTFSLEINESRLSDTLW